MFVGSFWLDFRSRTQTLYLMYGIKNHPVKIQVLMAAGVKKAVLCIVTLCSLVTATECNNPERRHIQE
jgi:hypothetical protein